MRSDKEFETLRSLIGYVVSGALGVATYAAVLTILVKLGTLTIVAFTFSYTIAVTVQFLLNRFWSFRALTRPVYHQAATYLAITILNYGLMIAVEEFGVLALHLGPLAAFLISVPVNLPVGYLANRYITFRK